MVISKRRGSVYSKMCCLFIGLGFVLWLTEPCRFRITTNVSEHVLHEALFYKRPFIVFSLRYELSLEKKNSFVDV